MNIPAEKEILKEKPSKKRPSTEPLQHELCRSMKEDYMLSQSARQTDSDIEKNWRKVTSLDKQTQTEGEEVKDNNKARKSLEKKKSTEEYDIKLTWSDSIIDKVLKLLKKDRLSVAAVFKQLNARFP